jgi:predicted TPR repeat methyltransferase
MSESTPVAHQQRPLFRRLLTRVPGLRSTWQLGRTLRDVILDSTPHSQIELQQEFSHVDPWRYTSNQLEIVRHRRESQMLDTVRGASRFGHALELGCAEGIFTEILADKCDNLLAVDFNEVALSRARQRKIWDDTVRFSLFDLRSDPLPGNFDLILAVHTLEYLQNPVALRRIRKKIVSALRPGGYLLLGCVCFDAVNEQSWWSRYLLRGGKQINAFFMRHSDLTLVDSATHALETCVSQDILLRKVR